MQSNNGENFTFFGNSRNDKVTEWRGEAYSKIDSEMLILSTENNTIQLNKYAEDGLVKYGQGFIDFKQSSCGLYTNCVASIICNGKSNQKMRFKDKAARVSTVNFNKKYFN